MHHKTYTRGDVLRPIGGLRFGIIFRSAPSNKHMRSVSVSTILEISNLIVDTHRLRLLDLYAGLFYLVLMLFRREFLDTFVSRIGCSYLERKASPSRQHPSGYPLQVGHPSLPYASAAVVSPQAPSLHQRRIRRAQCTRLSVSIRAILSLYSVVATRRSHRLFCRLACRICRSRCSIVFSSE